MLYSSAIQSSGARDGAGMQVIDYRYLVSSQFHIKQLHC